MYYVYILLSLKDRRFYIGFTSRINIRLSQHNEGLVKSTRSRRPLKLVYFEAYINKQNAKEREKFYKSGRGREVLKKILKTTFRDI